MYSMYSRVYTKTQDFKKIILVLNLVLLSKVYNSPANSPAKQEFGKITGGRVDEPQYYYT